MNLDEQMRRWIGARAYEATGLKFYLERVFQEDTSELNRLIATQRLKALKSVASTWNILAHTARTPVQYARPAAGFGVMYTLIEQTLRERGVEVALGHRVQNIRRNKTGFEVTAAEPRHYDAVVSTLPVTTTVQLLGTKPPTLESLSLISLFYEIHGSPTFDGHVLYNFTPAGRWKRLTVSSRVYRTGNDCHAVTVESTTSADQIDLIREHEDFVKHARENSLFQGAANLVGNVSTPFAYPAFRSADTAALGHAQSIISQAGLYSVGRQASHAHLSSSAVARLALELTDELTESWSFD